MSQGLPEGYDNSINIIKERQSINQYKEKEIEKNYQKYLLTECPTQEIKQKQIPSQNHKEMIKKTAEAAGIVLGLGAAAVITLDVISNPEFYITTMNNFQADSFSGFIERLPENLTQVADTVTNTFKGR